MYLINMSGFGIDPELTYTEVSIDSLDGNVTDARYSALDWPTFIFSQDLRDIAALKVLSAEVPFSYYVIDTINNKFTLSESGGGGNTVVTIPIGNYTTSSLTATLATALTTASAGLRTYTVTFSSTTGKFSIASNAPLGSTFTLTFGTVGDDGDTNPRLVLGFNAGSITSSTIPSLTAPNVVQISGPNYLYLNSKSMGSLCSFYLPDRETSTMKGGNGPQMAKIPINCNPGEVCFYQDPDPEKWFNMENLNFLSAFDLFFTRGNQVEQYPLKFNGQNFSIKLALLLHKSSHGRYVSKNSNTGVKMVIG